MKIETAQAILDYEDDDEVEFFEEVMEPTIIDKRRWITLYETVWKDTRDNTYWRLSYEVGSTEYQDCDLNLEVEQVRPVEKTIITYVSI